MSHVVLTGASGFIGRQLERWLRERHHQVTSLGRGDLQALRLPSAADAVIHLAGRAHVLREQTADAAAAFREVNVELTARLAAAARARGIRRFVFVSSAGVLGNASPPRGFADDSPAHPHDEYTRSKWAAELWLHENERELEKVIVRPPLVYGPGAPGNFARIERGLRAGVPLPIGALHAPRSIVGVRNLSSLLETAAVHPFAPGETLLVADEAPVSIAALARAMSRAMHRPARLVPVPAPVLGAALRVVGRRADAQRLTQPFVLEPARARTVLGWRPPFTLQDELAFAYGGAV